MKKIKTMLMTTALAGLLLIPAMSEAGARVYVRIGPPKARVVKVVRPARPFRNAVWVNGHYKWVSGRYVWVQGRYIQGRRNWVYVQPHWVRTPRGHYFVAGHWVKR